MNKTGILTAFLLIVMVFSIPAMAEDVISNISNNQSTEQSTETNKEENNDYEEINTLGPSNDKKSDKDSNETTPSDYANEVAADPDLEIMTTFFDEDATNEISTVSVGQLFWYTIMVINNGPEDDTNVTVNIGNLMEMEESGLAMFSWLTSLNNIVTENDTAFDPETGVWNIGDLDNGNEALLMVLLMALEPGTVEFLADVSGNGVDFILENNEALSTLTIETPQAAGEPETRDQTSISGKNVPMKSTGMGYATIILAILLVALGSIMPRIRV